MISLRSANISDLDLVTYWDTQQHVIASDPDDEWDWSLELRRDPVWREQLIAELEGEAIGLVQIIDPSLEETNYWQTSELGLRAIDIWIGEQKNLNKGYGTLMMCLAIERCFRDESVHTILIDPLKSNAKAQRFYKRLGFEFVGEREFGDDICMVYRLKRDDLPIP